MLDTRGFFPDNSPNPALGNISNTLTENKRYKEEKDYRRAKDQEGEDWRKLNLIQDLTDLSKHQTSSDVANAVGNQKASELLQKYTAGAKTISPAELQAKISQDMSGLIGGMDAMKNELDMSDAMIKMHKQQFPSLDAAKLAQEHRADILHRRMDSNMNFINPMSVPQSEMDLSDPEFLSDYITGNKNLVNEITNPKGLEETSVLMGTPDSHTTFSTKIPYFKKTNFDPTKLKEGYLTGKEIPQLQIKGSALPSDAMPSSNGKPFMVIDKDVYDRFNQDDGLKMELIKMAKQAFPGGKNVPGYKDMNAQEKEYAKRNVLYNNIETLDQTNFHPTGGTKPARISVHVPRESKPATPIDLTDPIYTHVEGGQDIMSLLGGVKVTGLPTGTSLLAKSAVFDPKKQTVTYQEYTDKPDEQKNYPRKTVSLTTFLQNVKTLNPTTDMKFLEGLRNPITGAAKTEASSSGKMVTMVLPDGRKGQIPEDKVAEFLKENPKAKRQ